MPSLSSLLTFESTSGGRRTSIAPPTTHLLATSTYPAPSNFLPVQYARTFLDSDDGGDDDDNGNSSNTVPRANRVVIWIGCDGNSEVHHRSVLKRNGINVSKGKNFIFIDGLEDILDSPSGSGSSSSSALQLLLSRVDEQLEAVSRYAENGTTSSSRNTESDRTTATRCMVILDDASALAWAISELEVAESEELDRTSEGGSSGKKKRQVDPRVELLRSKRKGAIQNDQVGIGLAVWIEEHLRERCNANSAILFTHLSAEHTTIIPPVLHTQARGGGSYGVGTGFDADDAGEENEEEELYDEIADPSEQGEEEGEGKNQMEGEAAGETIPSPVTFTKETVDWRVDSMLRKLLVNADLWIEVRGLRSGKARDCHGEICIHPLFRACMARHQPLPHLPLPSDPLRSLRSKDRISRPLANLNSLSLSTQNMISVRAWNIESPCIGREQAMLFRIEPVGEAQAWSRGAK